MPSSEKCGECGTAIPADSPGGFCAQCLLGLGLQQVQSLKSEVQSQEPQVAGQMIEKAGDRIGRYRLLQEIGHGGCGVVYMAEQEEPVRRKVALKVIKLGMDTRQVVARFAAERQALALMDHPNIAKVLDAGATESGRPYFVMELVGGIKITDYCDQNNLTTRQRLDLIIQVCRAIQHAHQKGIIHRDIKPSNVLVALQDGVAAPKVIDFGIAKATEGRLTDQTLFTAFEQFIGTPAYMSPEQAELGGLDVDTRSDIYSLGMLLYELLTGKTPFDAKELLGAGVEEMRRVICEKEPPTPSTRLTGLVAADVGRLTTSVDEKHRASLRRLLHKRKESIAAVRGDLDWIAMKCLEKDRARRYETANGLARDIERHLSNEPVVAGPPSNLYRFQKLVRRNKILVTAGGAVVAVLVLGVVASTWQALRATRAEREQSRLRKQAQTAQANEASERQKAQTEAAKSQQVARFLKDMLRGVGPSKALGRDTTMLREILDKTAERVGKELTNQPDVEIDLRATLADTYREAGLYKQAEENARESLLLARARLGEETLPVARALHLQGEAQRELGDYEQAEAAQRESVRIRRKLLGNAHADLATSLDALAIALHERNKLAEAEATFQEALAITRKVSGNEGHEMAAGLNNFAAVLEKQGKLVEAEAAYREALAIYQKELGNEHPNIATVLNNVATVLQGQGKLAEAETVLGEALAMSRKLFGNEHPSVAGALDNLAMVLDKQDRLAEAEPLARKALEMRRNLWGNQHPKVAQSLNNLATVLHHRGNLADAETIVREALAIRRKLLGNQHPDVAGTLNNLSAMVSKRGDLVEAEALAREALQISRKQFGNSNKLVALSLNNLAFALRGQGKLTEAEPLFREALDVNLNVHGAEHPLVALALQNLAWVLRLEGQLTEAEALSRKALAMGRKLLGSEHPQVTSAFGGLIHSLQRQGKADEVEMLWRERLDLMRLQMPDDDPRLADVLFQFASALLSQKKFADAEIPARECLAIREKKLLDDPLTFSTRSLVGATLLGQKKYAEAEPLLLSGYEGMRQREARIPSQGKPHLRKALERLVNLYEATGTSEQAVRWKKTLEEFEQVQTNQIAPGSH